MCEKRNRCLMKRAKKDYEKVKKALADARELRNMVELVRRENCRQADKLFE